MLIMATSRALALTLAMMLLCTGFAFAKPPLSTEVARVIDSQGVEAARQHFAELWANAVLDYEVDVDGLADLGSRYLQEGDIEAGMALMEMVSIISLEELDAALESQAALIAEMEAAAAEIAAEAGARAVPEPGEESWQPVADDRGPARRDLERFIGLYASDQEPGRELFVTQTCAGFLLAGPLWADTAPWSLRSVGSEAFSFQQGGLQFQLEFTIADDGAGRLLSHTIRGLASPMQRRGPLPGDWPRCQAYEDSRP